MCVCVSASVRACVRACMCVFYVVVFCLFCFLLFIYLGGCLAFIKINIFFSKEAFHEYQRIVKQFGSRSNLTKW